MEADTVQENASPEQLEEQLAQSRGRLDELAGQLSAVDAELESLAPERRQYTLLGEVCGAMEQLRDAGGEELFWAGAPALAREEHLGRVRGRVMAFQVRHGDIEARRRRLMEELGEQHQQHFLLEDEAFEAQEEEEKRRNEWLVEREIGALQPQPQLLLWARGLPDDRRFRKSVGVALLVCLLFAVLMPFIDLPIGELAPEAPLPERVVTVIPEVKKLETAPPPPLEMQPVQRKTEPKPVEQPEQAVAQEVPQEPVPAPAQGLLAFRDKLTVKEVSSTAQLGKAARLNSDDSAARPDRSMLTSNVPGSSGGIQLSDVSRGFGANGGSERGAIQGTALTRASSNINSIAAAARPLSDGPGLARTDEEIQIVFDRHKASLYRLYNRELRRDPTLQGKIILRLTIEPDGSVSMSMVQSTEINAPELSAQVAERVRGFDFGAKAVPAVTIVYPIDFLPAG
jgi:hypothetical protein